MRPTRFRLLGDRFRIEEESGAGGMGTVYRAFDQHSGGYVALKVLQRNEGRAADRFHQEAALLAELSHPAIVRYVHHGVATTGEPYLAMEWLDGETLEDLLQKGKVGLLEVARLGRRVVEALAVAHAKGIIHRDIKPANLFLPQGDLARVKVLDFGIARRMFESRRITVTGATLGTPMYMSPEQARGAASIDARSDLFSLGCVLFECVTGRPPFTAESPVAVLAKICLEELDVGARCRNAPAPFVALLGKMLDKDPRARGTATQLTETLDEVIDLLANLGFRDPDAVELQRRLTPILTSDEQRVLSAILVSRPRPRELAGATGLSLAGTWDIPAGDGPSIDVFDEAGFASVQEAIQPFGGRVDRFLGGSMLITLVGRGTPTDQTVQAARCALRLKSLLPKATLAISTGRADVGGQLPIGQVIDWVARLLAGEKPGSLCLDDRTAELLETRFEVGGGEGKRYLLYEKGLDEAPRTVLGKEMPCVGRDRELASLEALWDECTGEPTARVMIVTAPAGGGKSRVRHELLERIQHRGAPFEYLIGRGDSLRAGSPYGLLGPALRAAAGIVGGERLVVQRRRLQTHLERHLRPEAAARVSGFLGEVAGVPFSDDELPALRAARADPRLLADQVLTAWLDWLEAECAVRPVLLVLEDLHWGDAASVQLIDAALRTLSERPLMVLAFARPEVNDTFPGLWNDRNVQRMALAPLTSRACQKLACHVLGQISPEKAAFVVDRADGNPFYLEELLRAVAAGISLEEGALPATVLGMVQARFDALGSEAKRVLRAASVFGETFRPAGVKALLGEDTTVDEWLQVLVQREVVFPRHTASTDMVFRHALLRDAAYQMLTVEDRRLGHQLAGEYLERSGERAAIVLVEHFERAGVLPRAAHWSRMAAAQALDANDLAAVVSRVERGVRCGAKGEMLGMLRLCEAQARFWRGEYGEAEAAARAALDEVPESARPQAMGELIAALGQQARFGDVERCLAELPIAGTSADPRTASAWRGCLLRAASCLLAGGRYDRVERLVAAVEADAGAGMPTAEPAGWARLLGLRAQMAVHQGNQARAVPGFEAALAAWESLGDARSSMEMLLNMGAVLGDLGMLEEADRGLSAALVTADRLALGSLGACILLNLALVRSHLGRLEEARTAGERARALAHAQGDRRVEGAAEIYLSLVALRGGRAEDAEAHARTAVAVLAEVPPMLPAAVAACARALLAQGRFPEAADQAASAHVKLETQGHVEDGEALIRLAHAESLLALGQPAAAADVLARAAARLGERAAAIDRRDWREAFLRLPDHARTLTLAREHPTAS